MQFFHLIFTQLTALSLTHHCTVVILVVRLSDIFSSPSAPALHSPNLPQFILVREDLCGRNLLSLLLPEMDETKDGRDESQR